MVGDVDYCIEQMEDWKNCTNDYIDDEDPDNNRRVDVDIISDSSHEKPYDEFTARAQQVKSDALATDEAVSLLMGDGEAVTITSSCLSVDVTKKKPPVSVQHLPLLNSSSHLPGKVRAGRKKFYAND